MKYTEIKITGVKVLDHYTIEVSFNDGKISSIVLKDILYGALFGPLRNPEIFNDVRLNPEVQTIEWPNGADFHPETLYNWDDYKPEFDYSSGFRPPVNYSLAYALPKGRRS